MEETDAKKTERAKRYNRLNNWLTLANYVYFLAFILIILFTRLSSSMASGAITLVGAGLPAEILYIVEFILLAAAVMLPLGYYSGFTVEHRFGLSNQTLSGWTLDEIKNLVLSIIIFTPLALAVFRLLSIEPTWWWLYAALLWSGFGFVLAYLAPVLIMPLFNKFEPLEDTLLKEDIIELAENAKIGVRDVLRTDLSKRTKKANAFFAGLGNTKRIVLGDTLLANYSRPEILTVIGHEMGHWKLGHLWKNTLADIAGSLAGFYLADRLLRFGVDYFGFAGRGDIAGLPLIVLAFMILGLVAMPAGNALSRRFERQADLFELKLIGQPQATISTFEKLASQNLADPEPDPVIEFLLYSHPPIAKRIKLAKQEMIKVTAR